MVKKLTWKPIEVAVRDEWKAVAIDEAHRMGILKDSITEGEGTEAAVYGELAVSLYLGVPIESTANWDMVYKGLKIDVKTKRTTRPFVNSSFDASIAQSNVHQRCDIYVFTRANIDLGVVWIAGWLGRLDFFDAATFLRKGTHIGSNNFVVRADCYNLKYSLLKPIEELLGYDPETGYRGA